VTPGFLQWGRGVFKLVRNKSGGGEPRKNARQGAVPGKLGRKREVTALVDGPRGGSPPRHKNRQSVQLHIVKSPVGILVALDIFLK